MTPEQKAVYEYGKARGILKERKELMISMEGEFDAAVFYPEYRELYHIEEAIREAWQKRAACRECVPTAERDCPNCKYYDLLTKQYPCRECYLHDDQRLWKPRKEGE